MTTVKTGEMPVVWPQLKKYDKNYNGGFSFAELQKMPREDICAVFNYGLKRFPENDFEPVSPEHAVAVLRRFGLDERVDILVDLYPWASQAYFKIIAETDQREAGDLLQRIPSLHKGTYFSWENAAALLLSNVPDQLRGELLAAWEKRDPANVAQLIRYMAASEKARSESLLDLSRPHQPRADLFGGLDSIFPRKVEPLFPDKPEPLFPPSRREPNIDRDKGFFRFDLHPNMRTIGPSPQALLSLVKAAMDSDPDFADRVRDILKEKPLTLLKNDPEASFETGDPTFNALLEAMRNDKDFARRAILTLLGGQSKDI